MQNVLSASRRTDLVAVYAVTAHNELRVLSGSGPDVQLVKEVHHANHSKLEKIKARIVETRAYYQALNDGRPIF